VTHDEDLVADTATRIWHLDKGVFTNFKGSYEEFQATMAANAK
jgi:ATPase subunit of ABC transporter with duplicated ATPase domains